MCDLTEDCQSIAVQIRNLIGSEASVGMKGAMAGEPLECFAFAKEWIKKQKGEEYVKKWFSEEKDNNCGICQDSPCERESCKRELFKIEGCKDCPAEDLCLISGMFGPGGCKVARKIEKLVNERNQ